MLQIIHDKKWQKRTLHRLSYDDFNEINLFYIT